VVQKVPFLGNTDNVNFGWFSYDMEIIRARLKVAEALAKELRNGKTHH